MPIYSVVYIAKDDPALFVLPKRINWGWLGYARKASVSLEAAREALAAHLPDVVVACAAGPDRTQVLTLVAETCPQARTALVDPARFAEDPEGTVGRLIDTLGTLAREISEETLLVQNSAFVTRRAEELSQRLAQWIDAGEYGGMADALSAYVEMVVARSAGSSQFIYVKIMELFLWAGYKPMQLKTCFDRLLEGDFSKKLQQRIAHGGGQGLDSFLCDAVTQSIAQGAATPPEKDGSAVFERAIRYINENYQRKVSLEEVSHQAYMSSSYFSNSFHQRMGITFSEYLSLLRMNRAKELLSGTGLRIYEVAEKSGYEDFRHFSKMFKKHTGMSPAEYRREARG